MSPGSYISFALHLGFDGLAGALTGIFPASRSEMAVADVSVVSSEVFDVMVNNDSSPEISAEIPSAEASPGCGGRRRVPARQKVDGAPAQLAQSLSSNFIRRCPAFAAARTWLRLCKTW